MLEHADHERLITDWCDYRERVAAMLVASLNLDSPRDVLRTEHRGRHELPGTGYAYRTHGIGVDVTRKNGHGGIDFDFGTEDDELFAPPDWWRLVIFMRRVVHDPSVDCSAYRDIIDSPDKYQSAVCASLESQTFR